MEPSGPFWMRLLPDRIATQIALVVVVSVLLLHAAVSITVLATRRGPPGEHPAETTGRVAGFIQMLDTSPLSDRASLVARMMQASPGITFTYPAARAIATGRNRTRAPAISDGCSAVLPWEAERTNQAGRVRLPVTLSDGTVVAVTLPPDRPPGPPPGFGGALLGTAIFLLLILSLLGTWTVLFLLRPLRAMETAVESYGVDGAPEPLPESGPREIRTVAKAINRMQERIARLLEDRTRTLAAVGHDLRTPITRLRLRAEMFEDTPERARMLADLDQMDAMVQSALAHLRDGRGTGHLATFDLHSLLQTIADRYQDIGKPVTMAETGRVAVRGRPLDIDRPCRTSSITRSNTGRARPSLSMRSEARRSSRSPTRGRAFPGPPRGHAPALHARRGGADHERCRWVRLGLAITRAIVEAHEGTIAFADRQPRGFVVRVTLPVA